MPSSWVQRDHETLCKGNYTALISKFQQAAGKSKVHQLARKSRAHRYFNQSGYSTSADSNLAGGAGVRQPATRAEASPPE
jgi:hypothetical protein